jgi:hypothetical protein
VTLFAIRALSHIADKLRVCPPDAATKNSRREEPVIFARNFSREMLERRQIEFSAAAMQRFVREWRQVGISQKAVDDPAAEIMTIRR